MPSVATFAVRQLLGRWSRGSQPRVGIDGVDGHTPARRACQIGYSGAMSHHVCIEVDERTAELLEAERRNSA